MERATEHRSTVVPAPPPTTTSEKPTLPFPFRHGPAPAPSSSSSLNASKQQAENPNLVSLLSSNETLTPQMAPIPPKTFPSFPETSSEISSATSPHSSSTSFLHTKESANSREDFAPVRLSETVPHSSNVSSSSSSSSFPERCQSFFYGGVAPPSTSSFLTSCPTQTNALALKGAPSSSNEKCSGLIYKGVKKLCNAQSLFKCKASGTHQAALAAAVGPSNGDGETSGGQTVPFNLNRPFDPPPPTTTETDARVVSVATTSSTSSAGHCILGDLLRTGCKASRNKKNVLLTSASDPNNNNASHLEPNPGAPVPPLLSAPAPSGILPVTKKECTFNVSYYSQLLKKRIKQLYYDSEGESSLKVSPSTQKETATPPVESTSASCNSTRQTVISRLSAYPQQPQQLPLLPVVPAPISQTFASKMASDFGYKLPFSILSPSATVPPLTNQSVNSYLDSLIRSNVIQEEEDEKKGAAAPTEGPPPSLRATSPRGTPLSPNPPAVPPMDLMRSPPQNAKPDNFVNLIDKIISNVFTATTVSCSAMTNSVLSGSSSGPQSTQPGDVSLSTETLTSSSRATVLSSPPHPSPSSSPFPGQTPTAAPPGAQQVQQLPSACHSAISELLNSNNSPPSSPSSSFWSTGHHQGPPGSSGPAAPIPSTSNAPHFANTHPDCLSAISDKVYQQLIEFEFNHESILRKFQCAPSSDSFTSHGSFARTGLNANEKLRIDELESVLYPLQFCLSSMCEQRALLKANLHRSFFEMNTNVSVDFQRATLLATTEQAINLLIELTKQLVSFSELDSDDQMNLLRTSVMEIMLMRSILIRPQRVKEKLSACLKRCRSETETGSSAESSPVMTKPPETCFTNIYAKKTSSGEPAPSGGLQFGPEDLEPCTNHPHDRPFGVQLGKATSPSSEDQVMSPEESTNIGSTSAISTTSDSSVDSFLDEGIASSSSSPPPASTNGGSGDLIAADYAKQFRAHYIKLAGSIDKDWYEDRTIFYLLFAILLFRPTKSTIGSVEKVREEHLTYVYLLKRYLENKFKSYCTARSHFIRIFDRLEELQKMNDQVIQKLLDFDLVCAQNLLEKLCIC